MATEPTETYGGQLDAVEECFGPPCQVVTSLREIARDSFGPGWREFLTSKEVVALFNEHRAQVERLEALKEEHAELTELALG